MLGRDILSAFLIVLVIIGLVYAYTSLWPPLVVIESKSMQHASDQSFVGVIDTGDLVLVKDINTPEDFRTYVEGRASGYSTYGDYGDVLIFHNSPATEDTPIIHRCLLWADYSPSNQTYRIRGLDALTYGKDWTSTKGPDNRSFSGPDRITFLEVGYGRRSLEVPVSQFEKPGGGPRSGFVSFGDHNVGSGAAQTDVGSWGLIRLEWVVGVARGEIPWFGLLKLTFNPSGDRGSCCSVWGDHLAPANSWSSLLISVIALIAVPITIDFGLAYWESRREAKKEGPPPKGPG